MLSVSRWHAPKDWDCSWILPKITHTHTRTHTAPVCEQKNPHRLKTQTHTQALTQLISTTSDNNLSNRSRSVTVRLQWHLTQSALFVRRTACVCSVQWYCSQVFLGITENICFKIVIGRYLNSCLFFSQQREFLRHHLIFLLFCVSGSLGHAHPTLERTHSPWQYDQQWCHHLLHHGRSSTFSFPF